MWVRVEGDTKKSKRDTIKVFNPSVKRKKKTMAQSLIVDHEAGQKVFKIKKTCPIRCSKTLIGCVFIMERFTGFSPQIEFLPSLLPPSIDEKSSILNIEVVYTSPHIKKHYIIVV